MRRVSFLSPLTGLLNPLDSIPTVETVGYCRVSLTGQRQIPLRVACCIGSQPASFMCDVVLTHYSQTFFAKPGGSAMHSFVSCLMHVVFSTKERRPWMTSEIQERLWPYLGGIARENKMKALKVGGVEDHVHI